VNLPRLALSRSTVDRAAHRRTEAGLLDQLLADPSTAVLVLDVERAPVEDSSHGPQLVLLDPDTAGAYVKENWPDGDGQGLLRCYLGDDPSGRSHLVLARTVSPAQGSGLPTTQPSPSGQPSAPDPDQATPWPGSRWAGLRAVGVLLDDTGAGLFTAAVALANWHAANPRCSRCGGSTVVVQAGWARECPACGAEHYPRTDGAVIMAVVDDQDRILLGRQARWPDRRYSCLAGFVEPGESLEAAVRREVFEEAAVQVGEVEYRGSQPWPFPASLMVGFRARATSTEITVDGEELVSARWWSREELGLDIATGELLLPPAVSIARRLIEDWFGAPLRDDGLEWQ
jgi:NAD+ diphosphatase